MTPKKPRIGIAYRGATGRAIHAFLSKDPERKITYAFIQQKWGVLPYRARQIVSHLMTLGYLQTDNSVRPALVRLGDGIPRPRKRLRGDLLHEVWNYALREPAKPIEPPNTPLADSISQRPLDPLWWRYMIDLMSKGIPVIGNRALYSTPDF